MEEILTYLKNYINEKLNEKKDDPKKQGYWEYIYRPEIRSVIDSLNESESERFSTNLENWSEDIQYVLADEILFCDNNYIDKILLYCEIFSRTTKPEYGEYLLENFVPVFKNLNSENCSLHFLKDLDIKQFNSQMYQKVKVNISTKYMLKNWPN